MVNGYHSKNLQHAKYSCVGLSKIQDIFFQEYFSPRRGYRLLFSYFCVGSKLTVGRNSIRNFNKFTSRLGSTNKQVPRGAVTRCPGCVMR